MTETPDDATTDDATPGTTARARRGSSRSVFLPVGVTFLVLGLIGFVVDGMRASGFAFLPIGITFLVLGLVVAGDTDDDEDEDVTPR